MSENKGKVIHVNNLIIHAKNVEIVDPESVIVDREKHHEHHHEHHQEEDHIQRRNPWESFWGWQRREEESDQE